MWKEMDLLYQSIKCMFTHAHANCLFYQSRDKYVIVDGFHRHNYASLQEHFERENGMLPVSVIEKTSVIEWPTIPTQETERRGTTSGFRCLNGLGRNQVMKKSLE
jgi:hypothetical protein